MMMSPLLEDNFGTEKNCEQRLAELEYELDKHSCDFQPLSPAEQTLSKQSLFYETRPSRENKIPSPDVGRCCVALIHPYSSRPIPVSAAWLRLRPPVYLPRWGQPPVA